MREFQHGGYTCFGIDPGREWNPPPRLAAMGDRVLQRRLEAENRQRRNEPGYEPLHNLEMRRDEDGSYVARTRRLNRR